jgi:hypothetical protein
VAVDAFESPTGPPNCTPPPGKKERLGRYRIRIFVVETPLWTPVHR